jgi:uncharacterized protein YdeI (BOF family)
MSEYKVTWAIDIDANSAEDAVNQACNYIKDNGSQAHVFEVEDHQGKKVLVDLDNDTIKPATTKPVQVAVVIEGGLVQSIISNQLNVFPDQVIVIDYDDEGWEPDDISPVIQSDGSVSGAHVYSLNTESPSIDLVALINQFD